MFAIAISFSNRQKKMLSGPGKQVLTCVKPRRAGAHCVRHAIG
jgi:hypothetical protein